MPYRVRLPEGKDPLFVLRDPRLSLKARGLLAYITQPFVCQCFTPDTLQLLLPEGRGSIRTAMNELKELGLIERFYPKEPTP